MKASDSLKLFCADPYTGWVPREKQQDELRKIAARVEEVEQRAEELEHALEDAHDGLEQWHTRAVMLPTDAEGVPIRVGDELKGYGDSIKVVELRYGRSGWVLISSDGNGYADTAAFTHRPTVEDVLREFAQKMNENLGMYTGEAIDADEWRDADRQTIAEYAAKLRLAGEGA